MNPVLEQILIDLIKAVASPDHIEKAKADLVKAIGEKAAGTENKVDDALVVILAGALGVQYP